jgi:hypothetical protein
MSAPIAEAKIELPVAAKRSLNYDEGAELAAEREKVRVLRNAMKYLRNEDNYLDPEFDPCALASSAFDITKDAK